MIICRAYLTIEVNGSRTLRAEEFIATLHVAEVIRTR